jgi:transcriptional regulator with XRE-family HTH domain
VPQPRRQLGAELRSLRGKRTLAEVANALGWSEAKISRIENGRIGIDSADLQRLVDAYAPTDRQRARILALTNQSRRPAWWEPYTDVLSAPYEAYVAAEARATSISTFEAQLVPGLLQTAEYAKAVILADSTIRDPAAIDQLVQVRMARKAALISEPQPIFRVVLDEAVLARPVGGPDLFRRQLLSLVEASQRPNVILQVLSFATGAHRALSGSFTLLEFADEAGTPLVYCDGLTGGVVRTEPGEVQSYRESFDAVSAVALSREESRMMITVAAEA